MNFFDELKRRNVFKVGLAYVVMGWIILQVVSAITPLIDLPEWLGRTVLVLLAVGFPLALFFAWAFELTPDGVKRTEDVDPAQSVTTSTGRKIDFAIIGALVLAIGFMFYDRNQQPEVVDTELTASPIIAVLPFVNMSSDPEQEYFSDGISEEILNVLARTQGLSVVSRTSSFAFKGANRDITAIAASLRANIVLEGSVRKGGNQVRITAQLIDAATGLHLWSDVYDRELIDIFAIQDEIAQQIATALLGAVGIDALPERRFGGTEDMTAYNMYLQANALLGSRSQGNIEEAERLYGLAALRDPYFANAWAGLAKARLVNNLTDYNDVEAVANRALELDPDNGSARAVLGAIEKRLYNFVGANELLERAVIEAPHDADAFFWLGNSRGNAGDLEGSLLSLREGYRLNPGNIRLFNAMYRTMNVLGLSDEAIGLIQQKVRGELAVPAADDDIQDLAHLYATKGDWDAVQALFERIEDDRDKIPLLIWLGNNFDDRALLDRAREIFERENAANPFGTRFQFRIHMGLGDSEAARSILRQWVADKNISRFFFFEQFHIEPFASDQATDAYKETWRILDARSLIGEVPGLAEAYARAGVDIYHGMDAPTGENNGE